MSRDELQRPEAPQRLAEGADDAAASLRAFERRTRADGLEEAAAWRRIALTAPASTARRWFWSGAFVAAAAAAALIVRHAPVETVATQLTAPAPAPAAATKVAAPEATAPGPAPESRALRRLALSPRAIALQVG